MEEMKAVEMVNREAVIGDTVELQLFTTLKCNIRCTYCAMGVGDVLSSQGRADYSMDELAAFVEKQLEGKKLLFTFFGGEPLLNRGFIEAVMERFPEAKFQLQTNGTLLSKMPHDLLARFTNFLVSVDGGEEITDKYRGAGVYSRVMKNIRAIRPHIKGTLTARVTWADPDTSFDEMKELLKTFDQMYFQFAQADGVYGEADLVRKREVLDRMVEEFFAYEGLLKFVPMMGIVRNMLFPELAEAQCSGETHCRVSTNLLNIRPDGRIFGCPDMTWNEDMEHGSVKESRLSRSPLQRHSSMPCGKCSAHPWCRSNCLKNLHVAYVMNDEKYRKEVVEPVCSLVRHLGRKIAGRDLRAWYEGLSEADKDYLRFAEIYGMVEVIP